MPPFKFTIKDREMLKKDLTDTEIDEWENDIETCLKMKEIFKRNDNDDD